MSLRVKEICKAKGITQKQLAEQMGIAEISLSRSINTNPTLSTLENIAAALNVEVTELFAEKSDFVALISHNGAMYRFDNITTLKGFIDGLPSNVKE